MEESSDGRWTYRGTILLIEEYKKNADKFKSSSIRNEIIWKIISGSLKKITNFNSTQCENKFKNLKRPYVSKCDNMKSTSIGAPTIKFDYFNQISELFGNQPTQKSKRKIMCQLKSKRKTSATEKPSVTNL